MESQDELLDKLLNSLAVMKGAITIVLKHGDRLTAAERSKWLELAIVQSDQLNALMTAVGSEEKGPIRLPDAESSDAPAPPPSPRSP